MAAEIKSTGISKETIVLSSFKTAKFISWQRINYNKITYIGDL